MTMTKDETLNAALQIADLYGSRMKLLDTIITSGVHPSDTSGFWSIAVIGLAIKHLQASPHKDLAELGNKLHALTKAELNKDL